MRSNLAPRLDSFVGRDREVARLLSLQASGARLVTVVGMAGVGKTRLSREVGRALSADCALDEVCFCDLSDTTDEDGLSAAVSRALAVPLSPGAGAAQLGRALASRGRLLLVLDNFEQLVGAAAEALLGWLSAAADLRLLVTSRERLRVIGEQVLALGPLSLPEEGADPGAAEAVTLLWQRMTAAGSDPTAEDLPILARIAAALDGIPLALELAAARLGMMTPRTLLSRLEDRFELLRHGRRDAVARTRTLWNAIDWSWQMLSPAERATLARCSVFRGGWTVQAFEDVIADPDRFDEPAIDLLQSLCDKSLVRSLSTASGEARFDLYLTIRDFGRERLDELGGAEEVERRHLRAFAALASELGRDWTALPRASRERLAVEQDNLIAAARYGLAARGSATGDAVRCLVALEPLYIDGALRDRYRLLLERAEEVLSVDAPAHRDRGLIAAARGNIERIRGQAAAARRALATGVEVADAVGDEVLAARCLSLRAYLDTHHGTGVEATAIASRAVERARSSGDALVLAQALNALGVVRQHVEHDLAAAIARYEEALDVIRDLDAARGEAWIRENLGNAYLDCGQIARARREAEAALRVRRAQGLFEGYCMAQVALTCHLEDRYDEAADGYARAIAALRSVGAEWYGTVFTGYLGVTRLALGDAAGAREALGQATRDLADDPNHAGVLTAHLAACWAAEAPARARATLVDARELLGDGADPAYRDAVEIVAAAVDVAVASAADRGPHVERARALRRRTISGGGRSIDVWIALHLLERLLPALEAVGDASCFVIHPGCRRVDLPSGEQLDLRRRRVMRPLLAALFEAWRDRRGQPLGPDELLQAGWEGELMDPMSAKARLHVLVHEVRRLGLADVLWSQDDGYLIDPAARVEFR